MSSYTTISPDKLARLIGTAHMPALIDVRTDADFAADPRLIPGAIRRSHEDAGDWGGEFSGQLRHRRLPARRKTGAGHGGLAAACRRLRRNARRRIRGLERRQAAAGARPKLPPRDAKGRTVWVTRARPKIDRIACPWLIRRFVDPNAVIPVRRAFRGGRGRRALQRHALRHRERVLEPPRRALHLRRDDRGVRPRHAAAAAAGNDGARRRYRPARSRRRKRRGCSRPRSACRGCSTTISNSSRPASCSTTPSIAGAATPPAKPTTGRPTRRSRNGRRREHVHRSRCRTQSGHGISFGEAFRVWLRVAC